MPVGKTLLFMAETWRPASLVRVLLSYNRESDAARG